MARKLSDLNFDFAEYMQATEPSARVFAASDYTDEIIHELALKESLSGAGMAIKGAKEVIRFGPGELTIWAGINSHGKSRILSQIILGMCAQGYKSCITNFEQSPKKVLTAMAKQACMKAFPSPDDVRAYTAWSDGKLWIFDHVGRVDQELLYAVIRFCREKLEVTHFVIDNLQMVVAGEDDYTGQKDFVQSLKALSIELEMHIHLVHHVRKADNEDRMPGKFDIRGASSIVDIADNAMIMWRNKAKERMRAQRYENGGGKFDDSDPDAQLAIVKNREGGNEVMFRLWFDPQSTQYLRDQTRAPIDLMRKSDW